MCFGKTRKRYFTVESSANSITQFMGYISWWILAPGDPLRTTEPRNLKSVCCWFTGLLAEVVLIASWWNNRRRSRGYIRDVGILVGCIRSSKPLLCLHVFSLVHQLTAYLPTSVAMLPNAGAANYDVCYLGRHGTWPQEREEGKTLNNIRANNNTAMAPAFIRKRWLKSGPFNSWVISLIMTQEGHTYMPSNDICRSNSRG